MAVLFVLHAETDDSSAQVVESGWCGENAYYYIYTDGTLQIYGSGEMYDYTGFTHAPWYGHRDDISKIVIGNEITRLGASAFIGLKHVTELTVPITLNSVVSDVCPAFAGCYRIEKINFTCGRDGCGFNYAAYKENNSWYQNTPWYQSRDVLKEINFADGIVHIGNDAFRELNITALNIPQTVTSLGNHCFFNCTEITELTIPVSLNPYGNEDYPAFQGCMAVKDVTFTRGNGVPFDYTDWLDDAYKHYLAPWNMNRSIVKNIVISDDVTRLGEYMFYTCNIGELTIPISTEFESERAFYYILEGYGSLEKITITKGVGPGIDYGTSDSDTYKPWNASENIKWLIIEDGVRIGERAFYCCMAETIVIGDSVTLGEYAFGEIHVKNLVLPIDLNASWLDKYPAFKGVAGLENVTFTAGSGYGFNYAAYEGSNCWYQDTPWYLCRGTLKEIVFKDGIKSLGSDAFRELNLTSIVIPNSVVSLGCHTFYHCDKLRELTIPITLDSVYSAKYPAFDQCNGITVLNLTAGSNGVGYIYLDYVPIWCTNLDAVTQISLDSKIAYLGYNVFCGFSFYGPDGGLLPMSATSLSGYVFAGHGGTMTQIDGSSEIFDSVGCTGAGPTPELESICVSFRNTASVKC